MLSDTHLGRERGGARSAGALRPLLEGIDRLVINGDVAEIADSRLRAAAAREVVALHELCDGLGVELVLIAGNHDPMISERRDLTLADGQVYLTHGDVLHPAISPWASHADLLREHHRRARELAERSPDGSAAVVSHLEAVRYAAHFEWDELIDHVEPPHGGPAGWLRFARQVGLAGYYWTVMPRAAARYAAFHMPRARFFVFGHIHKAGVWTDGDRTIINTGSFGIPGRPRGVVVDEHTLRVRPIRWRQGAWHWGAKDHARFALRVAEEAVEERRVA